MGRAARLYIRSVALGVDAISKISKISPHVDAARLNEHATSFGDVRRYFVIAALATRPVEAIVLELLVDDRFLRRCVDLKKLASHEMYVLTSIPDSVRYRFAALLGDNMVSLRSGCLQASSTSIGYADADIFDLVSKGSLKSNTRKRGS